KRFGSAPGDPALGVDAFEVANQQQSGNRSRAASWGGPSWRGRSRHIALRRRRRSRALAAADSTDDRRDDSRPSASSSPSPTSPAVGRVFVCPSTWRSVVRFSRVSKLIYITNASLDGYIEDKTGAFDWGNPDQVFDFITELMRPIGTHLLGRRLYETMAHWDGPLEGYPPEHRDFARVWQKAEQIVF